MNKMSINLFTFDNQEQMINEYGLSHKYYFTTTIFNVTPNMHACLHTYTDACMHTCTPHVVKAVDDFKIRDRLSKLKIQTVELDLYYIKSIETKIHIFWWSLTYA